jgi:NADP-dependent 3-hydroxy acid dehydrogenase YdfG
MTTRNDTHGKVAVVTGASSGIGAATARALVADGYRVALLARRLDRISSLADELGNGSVAIEADVTDRGSIVAAADRVRQELGNADVLINNAGVMLLGPFDSDQRDDYRQMIEVNLLGAITTTEVFLDQVKDAGGDIINISSVAGRTARSGNGVYAATKWGINGWSESLRQELLPDVCVTLVEPGVVATELPNHITHADTKHGVQQLYDKAEVTADSSCVDPRGEVAIPTKGDELDLDSRWVVGERNSAGGSAGLRSGLPGVSGGSEVRSKDAKRRPRSAVRPSRRTTQIFCP